MKLKSFVPLIFLLFTIISCKKTCEKTVGKDNSFNPTKNKQGNIIVDQFADINVLRYSIDGWDNLTLKEQKLVYYLIQAGLSGRDIMWDQNYRHNLEIRDALENIYKNYGGDKSTDDWKAFEVFLKRIWFSNGIHHHYSNNKLKPEFSQSYLKNLIETTDTQLSKEAFDVLFNDADNKKVNKKKGIDNVLESAVNFYGQYITNKDVDDFYAKAYRGPEGKPIEAGLNSQLVRENGQIVEKVWKSGGMYGEAIDGIIHWLGKAKEVVENEKQAKVLDLLIQYYKTGDLDIWDQYCIQWVKSTEGNIDWINGFVEVYNDPKGYRGSYEMIVQIKDFDMSKKMDILSKNAQWFEDNAPLQKEHKKANVVGVSYKTVIVAGEAGDASPSTPIGVNLPNNNWIRKDHGSKSISLANIIEAYNSAQGLANLKEFAHDKEEIELGKKYEKLGDKLHTALHEVIGHASGQINPGVGQPKETLKQYASTIEEGRADLIALYYLMNPKLQELGLVTDWEKIGQATYNNYIRNGLMEQLSRLELGDNVEEDHMVNRQWISAWAFEQGEEENVILKIIRDGKTYYNINDYQKLREIFGRLLKEVQRMKSEGDFKAAQNLVEGYGVEVDQKIHAEVLKRSEQFPTAPYSGFVNPILVPSTDENGEITSIEVKQPTSFEEQMLAYSEEYGLLSGAKKKKVENR